MGCKQKFVKIRTRQNRFREFSGLSFHKILDLLTRKDCAYSTKEKFDQQKVCLTRTMIL